jgi:hypothetical protein
MPMGATLRVAIFNGHPRSTVTHATPVRHREVPTPAIRLRSLRFASAHLTGDGARKQPTVDL